MWWSVVYEELCGPNMNTLETRLEESNTDLGLFGEISEVDFSQKSNSSKGN